MFAPPLIVSPAAAPLEAPSTPAPPSATPPSSSSLTSPPCLIMLGGLGDLLIALPIAWHYAQRFGERTPVLTSARYQNILAACSYVLPVGYTGGAWRGYREAIAWARARFPAVYPLHVGDPDVQANLRTERFCHEQYLYAGVEGRYGEFPLVFDRRDPAREAALVTRLRSHDPRPLFLYNFTGRSSPFAAADTLLAHLRSRWGAALHLLDTSRLDLPRFHELLALASASIGLLTIDTSTLHLMPASGTPYIALVNDTKSPWWSSVPRGNCVLQLGYTETLRALPLIDETIERMVAGGAIAPVTQKAIRRCVGAPAPGRATSQPHLITLACSGMEKVWRVAARTWEPWCAARNYPLSLITKPPRPDLAPSWNKLPLVLDALTRHETVWWIDSDITVARPTSSLPDSRADLLFATDWNGLCAAMFRARATEWTKAFLQAALLLGDVRDPDAFGKGCGIKWEQNAFKALLATFPSCDAHVELLPRSFMCDRPTRPDRNPDASFYHFGGMRNGERIAAMRRLHSL